MGISRTPPKLLVSVLSRGYAAPRTGKPFLSAAVVKASQQQPNHTGVSLAKAVKVDSSFVSAKYPKTEEQTVQGQAVQGQAVQGQTEPKELGPVTQMLANYTHAQLDSFMNGSAKNNVDVNTGIENTLPSPSANPASEAERSISLPSEETQTEFAGTSVDLEQNDPVSVDVNFTSNVNQKKHDKALAGNVLKFQSVGDEAINAESKAASETDSVNINTVKVELDNIGKPFDAKDLLFSKSLQDTANKFHAVVSLRFPSEIGQLHLSKNFPTKNFHVKAKSSDMGPMAGFIAAEAKYSKVGGSLNGIQKQKNSLNKALNLQAHVKSSKPVQPAKTVPLKLDSDIVGMLVKEGKMSPVGGTTDQFMAEFHPGSALSFKEIFTISPPDYAVLDGDGKPVMLLTNPPEIGGNSKNEITDKPITADYDLFSIIPNKNHSNNPVPVPVKGVAKRTQFDVDEKILPKQVQQQVRLNVSKAVKAFTTDTTDLSKMDVNKGNFHLYGQSIANSINSGAVSEGFKGGKLVWHGDEINNPFSEGFDPKDKPLFFIPGFENPVQIESQEELKKLYKHLKENGYVPPS